MPRSLSRRLSYEARRSGRTSSSIVRDALERYLVDEDEVLPPFVGMGPGKETNLSRDVDVMEREIMSERLARKMGRTEAGDSETES